MAMGRPSDTDPNVWFCLAVQMDQNCAVDKAFRPRITGLHHIDFDLFTRKPRRLPEASFLHTLYLHTRQSSSHGYRCSKEGEGPPRHMLMLWKNQTLGKGLQMPLRCSLYGRRGDSEAVR